MREAWAVRRLRSVDVVRRDGVLRVLGAVAPSNSDAPGEVQRKHGADSQRSDLFVSPRNGLVPGGHDGVACFTT